MDGICFSHQDEESNVTCLKSVQVFHNAQEKGTTANYFKINSISIFSAFSSGFKLMINNTETDPGSRAYILLLITAVYIPNHLTSMCIVISEHRRLNAQKLFPGES